MTYAYPELKEPTDGQLAALGRYASILQSESIDGRARMEGMVAMERIMMSLVVDPEARPALQQALEEGEASLSEMLTTALGMVPKTPAPVKAVRRGRPRKSAV